MENTKSASGKGQCVKMCIWSLYITCNVSDKMYNGLPFVMLRTSTPGDQKCCCFMMEHGAVLKACDQYSS